MKPTELLDFIKEQVVELHTRAQTGFPVDIVLIASHLGVRYHEEELPQKIDGLYFRTSSGKAHICINNSPSKGRGRRRYSGAHEIVHHLAAEFLGLHEAYYLDTTHSSRRPLERMCDVGAACLLMPEDAVRRAWSELRLYSQAQILAAMSQCFGVTRSAMRVRLQELSLLPAPPVPPARRSLGEGGSIVEGYKR